MGIGPAQTARAACDGGDGDRPRARRDRYCCLRRPAGRRLPGQQRPRQRHRPEPGCRRLRRSGRHGGCRQPPGALGDVRAEERHLAANLRTRLQGRRMGDARVPGVAQHRSDGSRRGSFSRLRRGGPHRAVGVVVRTELVPRQQEADLREPLLGSRQCLAAGGSGPRAGPRATVAQHQRHSRRGESCRRRRGRRRGQ